MSKIAYKAFDLYAVTHLAIDYNKLFCRGMIFQEVSQIDILIIFPFPYFSTSRQATGRMPIATITVDVFDGVGVWRRGIPEDMGVEELPDPMSEVSTGGLGHVRVGVLEMKMVANKQHSINHIC